MNFNLQDHLNNIYGQFPEHRERPVIGITTNYGDILATLSERYYKQVVDAGGVPMLIPPIADADVVGETLEHIDGLLLTGGADYDPQWAGEERHPLLGNVNAERDLPELLITRLAYNRQIPMLGICRGMQTMAMALGGHVAQDNSVSQTLKADADTITHSQSEERNVKTHSVSISKQSLLHGIYGATTLKVNSFHHQSVDSTGTLFTPTSWADDGIMEAMESSEHKPMMGVQWHPECLEEEGLQIFRWLIEEASLFRKAKALHERIITFDSHCDTPMFFHQGADFSKRDERILVDLHKMTDGRQDAVNMVAYIPQKAEERPAHLSPKEYADSLLNRIEEIVAAHPEQMALARCREDILLNKQAGKKSILMGIENALAIEDDIRNVDYFADRGCTYFTLCHNGDNQICDSCRTTETWHGVSPFGAEVIRRMNERGVLVDLSHSAESSFYDALEISSHPVVCSHSNCRALCDHPRNLTDDQLRALAAKGGVCQVTLYHGFLSKNPSEADILKAMEHLDHAVKLMGVEHVGLGTDFDGDGGVRGIKDSSEMILFTRQLLKRRYSDSDIERIWGENFLNLIKR